MSHTMLRMFHAIESVKDQARLPQSDWTVVSGLEFVQRGYSIALPDINSGRVVEANWAH